MIKRIHTESPNLFSSFLEKIGRKFLPANKHPLPNHHLYESTSGQWKVEAPSKDRGS